MSDPLFQFSRWKDVSKKLAKDSTALLLEKSGYLGLRAAKPGQWRILMYHRVNSPASLGRAMQPGMYVTPESFERQMAYLTRHYSVISLQELADAVVSGEAPPARSVVLTFDDGWLDNFEHAFPVLKRYQLPATIFLATDYINGNKSLWSDSIPYSLAALAGAKNVNTFLSAEGLRDFKESLSYLLGAQQAQNTPNAPAYIESLDSFLNSLKTVSHEKREALTDELSAIAALETGETMPRAFLNWKEVATMQKSGIDFACHTHSHIPLPDLDSDEASRDIQTSVALLKAQRCFDSNVFCYPEGRISEESQQVIAESGFFSAVLSTEKRQQVKGSPPVLPRIGIHDDITKSDSRFASRVWEERVF